MSKHLKEEGVGCGVIFVSATLITGIGVGLAAMYTDTSAIFNKTSTVVNTVFNKIDYCTYKSGHPLTCLADMVKLERGPLCNFQEVELDKPRSLDMDHKGNLYVAVEGTHADILKLTRRDDTCIQRGQYLEEEHRKLQTVQVNVISGFVLALQDDDSVVVYDTQLKYVMRAPKDTLRINPSGRNTQIPKYMEYYTTLLDPLQLRVVESHPPRDTMSVEYARMRKLRRVPEVSDTKGDCAHVPLVSFINDNRNAVYVGRFCPENKFERHGRVFFSQFRTRYGSIPTTIDDAVVGYGGVYAVSVNTPRLLYAPVSVVFDNTYVPPPSPQNPPPPSRDGGQDAKDASTQTTIDAQVTVLSSLPSDNNRTLNNYTTSIVSDTSFKVNTIRWKQPGNSENLRYQVRYCTTQNCIPQCDNSECDSPDSSPVGCAAVDADCDGSICSCEHDEINPEEVYRYLIFVSQTDSEATSATSPRVLCSPPPPPVKNFSIKGVTPTAVTLGWDPPATDYFVRIQMSTDGFPKSSTDGTNAYTGSETTATINDLTTDKKYFFTAMTESRGRNKYVSAGELPSSLTCWGSPEERQGERIAVEILPQEVTDVSDLALVPIGSYVTCIATDCRLKSDVEKMLQEAVGYAKEQEYTLTVVSAYRTVEEQRELHQEIGDLACGGLTSYESCPHVRGIAVDVTLDEMKINLGIPRYDKTNPLHRTLREIMERAHFRSYNGEYWHFYVNE